MQKINHTAVMKLLKKLTVLIDYSSGTNPIYIGKAHPGALTSEGVWQIAKLTYDVNDNVTSIKYAGETPNPDSVWDDRATLTYA